MKPLSNAKRWKKECRTTVSKIWEGWNSSFGILNFSFRYRRGLFVKASEKRKGIGTALLKTAEDDMRSRGITVSRVHLGTPREQWFESYLFYPATRPCYKANDGFQKNGAFCPEIHLKNGAKCPDLY